MDETPKPAATAETTSAGGKGRALCLCSGGLDSLLCLCVLREQGVRAEAIRFTSPFYAPAAEAERACAALGFKLHSVDFTDDICRLVEHPVSGLGSCLNPCIDCHARMIERAWEYARENGFDFVATGEVLAQRPMSQTRPSLNRVRNLSGAGDRLLRPLSALLLEETAPEREGLVDRSRLLGLSGRNRKPQLELAAKYGIRDFPSPAGGCRLTEPTFCRRLKNVMEHEGLGDRRLVAALQCGRVFRLPGGTLVILGRNRSDNVALQGALRGGDAVFRSVNVPGPTALAVKPAAADADALLRLIAAYADHRDVPTVVVRRHAAASRPEEIPVPAASRDEFLPYQL